MLYAAIWISSRLTKQTDTLAKTKLGFHVSRDRLFCSGHFQVNVFWGFFFCLIAMDVKSDDKASPVQIGKLLRKVELLLCSFNRWYTDAVGTFAGFYVFAIIANKSCWGCISEQTLARLFCGWSPDPARVSCKGFTIQPRWTPNLLMLWSSNVFLWLICKQVEIFYSKPRWGSDQRIEGKVTGIKYETLWDTILPWNKEVTGFAFIHWMWKK